MIAKEISGFFSAGLAVLFIVMLLGNGAADQNFSSNYSKVPQTAQEREGLFKAIQNTDEKNISQGTLGGQDPYKALQSRYAFIDPQTTLEQANTYKSIQKLNSIYQSPVNEDNWHYWSNMWLNGPQETTKTTHAIKGSADSLGVADTYSALDNPYAFIDPQTTLEQANTYKSIQKLNSIYQNPVNEDNWHYWSNMWLNGPQETTKTTHAIKGSTDSLGVADTYSALDNPYAFIDPQAALEKANTYKSIQKLNSIYQNPINEDSWYYWSNMWLNGPET